MSEFIKRPRKNLIAGWGINDADYQLRYKDEKGKAVTCPIYRRWLGLVARVHSPSTEKMARIWRGCEIDERWRRFSHFSAWMEREDWDGKYLDKDILIPGNKTYSPDNCLFVPRHINNLFTGGPTGLKNGSLPTGVTVSVPLRKDGPRYQANVRMYGKPFNLGTAFTSPEEARQAYLFAKADYVKELAEQNQDDPKLYWALMNWCSIFYSEACSIS